MTADEIASIIEGAAARHGVPTDALMAIANLESSGNVYADNPSSSASGLFQFVDSTAREYGLTGAKRNDPAAQAEAAAKMMATNARSLERTLGRPANAGELDLAHQQGLGGARALLMNPGMSAVDALTTVYGDRNKAAQAVALNGGNLNQSAGQFAGQWVNKANQRASLIPPAAVPNVVASELSVAPQTRNVPLPLPRPAIRKSAEESVRPYLTADMQVKGDNLPSLVPAQITPGLGSLTPDFFKTPAPPKRLPDIGSTSSPIGPGPTSLASVQDMYGRPQLPKLDPIGAGPISLASVQDMYGRPGGVGLPPATRSVPSVAMPALPPAIPGPNAMPKGQERLTAGVYPMAPTAVPNAVPAVATALDVVPNLPGFPPMPRPRPLRSGVNVQMPTPMGQRPTLPMPRPASFAMPTPAAQRPNPNALHVTVNGANSYSGGGSSGGSQPQTITGSSTGKTYNVGQQYQSGGYRFVATPDGFKNLGRV
jgi:hypothetical protein